MKLIAKVAALSATLTLLAGCSAPAPAPAAPAQPAAPAASTAGEGLTITDHAGRTVKLKTTATKVFGAGPPAVTLLYSLDPTLLAGWNTAPSAQQKEWLVPAVHDLPVLGRVTGGKDTFNPEILNANKVDLIVDAGDINPKYVSSADDLQAKTGIPVVMLSTDPAKMADAYDLLGRVTGKTGAADQRSTEVKRIAAAVAAGAAKAGTAKKKVFYAVGAKGLATSQSGSINARVVDAIGAENAAGTTTKSGRIDVTAEEVLAYAPDWVVISPDTPADAVATDPKSVQPLGGLKAITEGRYLVVPNGMPWGWFDGPPSVNQLLGMLWAGESIYPDAFDVDLAKETTSFYKLFFHRDLSDADAKKMLATAHTPGLTQP